MALVLLWLPGTTMPAAADADGPSEQQREELSRGALADRDEVAAAFARGVAAYDAGDYATAYQWWLPLARADDPAAQRNIAQLYRKGLGVEQDFATAAQWYRRAAESGLAGAQTNLASLYLRGQGVEQDHREAARWFAAAAVQGHVQAQYNLGLMYLRGLGVEHNEAKAAGWFYLAGKAGHGKSLDALSQVVRVVSGPHGPALPHHADAGTPAADDEDDAGPVAVQAVALMQDDASARSATKTALPADFGRSLQQVFEQSPGAGYEFPDIRPAAGSAATGAAVSVSAAEDEPVDTEREILQSRASAGDTAAQYRLARLYLQHGDRGNSPVIAYYWLARAAAGGHATARAEQALLQRTMPGSALIQAEMLLARWRASQG